MIDRKLRREKRNVKDHRGSGAVRRIFYVEREKGEGNSSRTKSSACVARGGTSHDDILISVFLSKRRSSENLKKLARKYIWTANGWTSPMGRRSFPKRTFSATKVAGVAR